MITFKKFQIMRTTQKTKIFQLNLKMTLQILHIKMNIKAAWMMSILAQAQLIIN